MGEQPSTIEVSDEIELKRVFSCRVSKTVVVGKCLVWSSLQEMTMVNRLLHSDRGILFLWTWVEL
mgnify:CR=1 FL=1